MRKARLMLLASMWVLIAPLGLAAADPGPVTSFLMGEQVPMLTFGLFRIELAMQKLFESDPVSASVNYNWDTNKIELTLFGFLLSPDQTTKEACRSWIKKAQGGLGVDSSTGKPYQSLKYSWVGDYFLQKGFINKNEPKDMHERLDEIVVIKVQLHAIDQKTIVKCQGDMMATEVLFSE